MIAVTYIKNTCPQLSVKKYRIYQFLTNQGIILKYFTWMPTAISIAWHSASL